MAKKAAKEERASLEVQTWLDRITDYEREMEDWEGRADKILKRYRDDGRKDGQTAKYNILWSNVQTLSAATFAKVPKPDVSRRYKDHDPVGRVAGQLLERSLDYEVQKYSTYAATLRACVLDRFLGGRGTAWVRYEPHFRAVEQQQPQDGTQVTEDIDQPQEELDYECAPCDYVHWRDFGHVLARTWEEVPAVWRKVYLTRQQAVDRFGKVGQTIPLDARPEDQKKKQSGNQADSESSRALVYEIWDKPTKQAIWLSKSLKQIVDQKADPLGLEDFWPCPKPLYSTLTNDSLIPVPDYALYQDQAATLDLLSDRIEGLIKALKVMGVYDAAAGDLQRLLIEGGNNTLIPVKNWTAFAEKNGLKGSIDLVDLVPIASALKESYMAMEQVKQQIYDITGISDIVRGQTEATETATAQQIKGQYASLRLRQFQDEVARFATEVLQIQSQIICNQFSPQSIATISAAEELPEADRQFIGPAIQLLTEKGPNPMRMFRIEVAADSLIHLDEQQEKQDRSEFLQSISGFMTSVAPLVQGQPEMLPLIGELLKFGVRAFKVGKSVESAFDMALEGAANKPPSPTAEEMKALDEKKSEIDQGMEQLKGQHDELKNVGHELDRKKNDIEKAQINLEKKALELGFREEAFGLEQDFTKKTNEIEQSHQEELVSKDKEHSESKLSESAKVLTDIAQGMKEMAESHVALTAEASGQLADAMKNLAEMVKAQNSGKKRVTRISKSGDGSYIAEDA